MKVPLHQLHTKVSGGVQGKCGVEMQAWAHSGYPDQVPRIGVRCASSPLQQAHLLASQSTNQSAGPQVKDGPQLGF